MLGLPIVFISPHPLSHLTDSPPRIHRNRGHTMRSRAEGILSQPFSPSLFCSSLCSLILFRCMLCESASHRLPAKPWPWQPRGHRSGRCGRGPAKCAQHHHPHPPEAQGICAHSPTAWVGVPPRARVGFFL